MDFYLELNKLGASDVLEVPSYVSPYLSTEAILLESFTDIIHNNLRVLIYGDYDPDGAICIQGLVKTFNHLGFKNYEVFKYLHRTHSIDTSAVNRALTGGYDYMIICDAGSQEPSVINRLNTMGVKTILIDHHESIYGYEDFQGAMVNTTFENRNNEEDLVLSAGALTFVVCEKLIRHLRFPPLQGLSSLALWSMYADSVDMSSRMARSIYYDCIDTIPERLPTIMQHFMNGYTSFNRRYMEFTLTPKINSLFRAEEFDLLNRYLYWQGEADPISGILTEIDEHYNKIREAVLLATDLMVSDSESGVEVLNNFVIGNLSSVAGQVAIPADKLHNYTGRVANILAQQYGKTAIVYADSGTEIKGSLRDQQNRNYLDLFRQFCECGGHPSAFGMHIPWLEFRPFLEYIRLIDKQYFINTVGNAPLIIPHSLREPDGKLLSDMARYNEFSGNKLPVALVSKIWMEDVSKFRSNRFGDKYYKWGSTHSVRTRTHFVKGSTLQIKPYKSKGTSLEVLS